MKRKKKKGQAIVEMAILFPVFLLVIVGGVVDFGFAFYNMRIILAFRLSHALIRL